MVFKCSDGNPAWNLIIQLVMLLGSKKLGGPWLSHLQGLQGCINAGGLPTSPCSFPYALLQTTTSNFSSSNLLGEGSFGHVYKARLDYGVFAAVKRLTNGGKQAEADFQVNSQSITDTNRVPQQKIRRNFCSALCESRTHQLCCRATWTISVVAKEDTQDLTGQDFETNPLSLIDNWSGFAFYQVPEKFGKSYWSRGFDTPPVINMWVILFLIVCRQRWTLWAR